jgi:predicted transcriptional regulator
VTGALSKEEREALQEIARRSHKSVSALVRSSVRLLLAAQAAGDPSAHA